jgi:hypothetical protein
MDHAYPTPNSSQTTRTQVGPKVSPTKSTFGDGDAAFVNKLFTQLQAIFPAWRQAFPDDAALAEAKRQWSMGIIEAGLTSGDAIKAGLAKARKSKNPFIPSVGMFIEWCRQAALEHTQFPSLDAVLLQITQYAHYRKFPAMRPEQAPSISPVGYWVYQHIDTYAVSRADTQEARRLVGVVYEEAREKATAGFDFPEPPQLIPSELAPTAATPESKERNRQTLNNLKSMFRGSQS